VRGRAEIDWRVLEFDDSIVTPCEIPPGNWPMKDVVWAGLGPRQGVWGYVPHDAVADVKLPKRHRLARRFFSVDEVQRILASAPEPYHTFYWLDFETGIRAGELCGL
jgi:integrase